MRSAEAFSAITPEFIHISSLQRASHIQVSRRAAIILIGKASPRNRGLEAHCQLVATPYAADFILTEPGDPGKGNICWNKMMKKRKTPPRCMPFLYIAYTVGPLHCQRYNNRSPLPNTMIACECTGNTCRSGFAWYHSPLSPIYPRSAPELPHLLCVKLLFHLLRRRIHVVVVEYLGVPAKSTLLASTSWKLQMIVAYIMIFHVSTGKSASLKLQSNFSSATGSSEGSW